MSVIPHRLYLMLAVAGVVLFWWAPAYVFIISDGIGLRFTWSNVLAFVFVFVGLRGWAMHKKRASETEVDVPEFLR